MYAIIHDVHDDDIQPDERDLCSASGGAGSPPTPSYTCVPYNWTPPFIHSAESCTFSRGVQASMGNFKSLFLQKHMTFPG